MLGSGQGAPLPPSAIQNAFQLAIEHQRAGRPAEAEALCRQILAGQGDHLEAMRLLAFLTHSSGRNAEAIEWIRRAVALRPDSADLHGNLGVLLASQGRFDDAIVSLRRALELNPSALEGYIELAAALDAKGQLAEAIAVSRQAVALQPNDPILRNNLGNALLKGGHNDDAIAEFRQALAFDPRSPEAHCNLGNAFNQEGQIDEALAAYQQAVALRPDYIEALNNLGVVLFRLNESEQAISTLRRAAALNPNHAETFYNLGVAFMEQSRPTEAITAYRRALTLRPRYGQAAWNLAWAYLLTGDFRQGWAFYEARWGTKEKFLPHNFPDPAWDGRPLEGRRIFIYAEQGFGDVIQMARLVPLVRNRGGRVILEVQPELKSLMTSLPGAEQVIAFGEPIPPFDAHCPLMSVPGRLDINLQTIPRNVPYLSPSAARVEQWRQKLAGERRLKVGLIWSGRPIPAHRSIDPAMLSPLGSVPGVRFYSLQRSDAEGASTALPPGLEIVDCAPDLHDFEDTAALLMNLDLLISIDTAAAHLAGALGRPAWVLLRHAPDWRWLQHRTDSPWYPSLKLFRQTRPRDWSGPIQQVTLALSKLVGTRHGK